MLSEHKWIAKLRIRTSLCGIKNKSRIKTNICANVFLMFRIVKELPNKKKDEKIGYNNEDGNCNNQLLTVNIRLRW